MNNIKQKNITYILTSFFVIIAFNIALIFAANISDADKAKETFKDENVICLPVIMYHNISEKPALTNRYCILAKQFEADLKYFKEQGYNCISFNELKEFAYDKKALPEKPFMITFDDGYESFYTYAYPLLKKYNMKAVMSIVGSYTDLFTKENDHNIDYSHLTWKQVNELNNSGFVEIQNHTYNMHEITSKRKGAGRAKGESPEQFKTVFKKDLEKLNSLILNYTGKKSSVFTYPYGNIADNSLDIIKEIGFSGAFTCTEQVNFLSGDPEELYHINRFNRDGNISLEKFIARIKKSSENFIRAYP